MQDMDGVHCVAQLFHEKMYYMRMREEHEMPQSLISGCTNDEEGIVVVQSTSLQHVVLQVRACSSLACCSQF